MPVGLQDVFFEFVLCKEVYHCTPVELGEVDRVKLQRHYAIYVETMRMQDEELRKANKNHGRKRR